SGGPRVPRLRTPRQRMPEESQSRQDFNLSAERDGERLLVACSGELDLTTAPELEELLSSSAPYGELEIDLGDLEFIDSSGLRLLLTERERLGQAVSEAATNAVVHAYADQPEGGTVAVEAGIDDDVLWVKVCDQGRGMRPRPDSPGLGLGLPLIAQMTTDFEVHEGDAGGTEVR